MLDKKELPNRLVKYKFVLNCEPATSYVFRTFVTKSICLFQAKLSFGRPKLPKTGYMVFVQSQFPHYIIKSTTDTNKTMTSIANEWKGMSDSLKEVSLFVNLIRELILVPVTTNPAKGPSSKNLGILEVISLLSKMFT